MKRIFINNYIKLIFFLIFIIGVLITQNYGIGIDEDNSRVNGFVSLKYIFDLLNISADFSNFGFPNIQNIQTYYEQGNGVVFDLPFAFLEYLLQIKDFRTNYLIRHIFNFIIFFIALTYFYKIIVNQYKSKNIAIIFTLLLFCSPRIFGESFYNSKDIGLMSFTIINLYYSLEFFEKKTYKNLFLFIIFAGLSCGIRILGLVLPLTFIILFLLDFSKKKNNLKNISFYLILLIFLPASIVFFWPYLWSNPVENFINAFNILSNHYRPIYNFFMGEYVSALYVPWFYSIVWISITSPLVIIFFFLLGSILITLKIYKRIINIENNSNNQLWKGKIEFYNLIYFLNVIIPISAVIILHSSLYSGWRHLYFIYPYIILISIKGLLLFKTFFKIKKKFIYIFLIATLFYNIFWIIKHHPFQYLYFNSIIGNKFNKYFDMDYWGVSNYNSLKFISSDNKKFTVGLIGDGDLILSINFLKNQDKKKITYSNNIENLDYVIDNFNRWNGFKKTKYDKILNKQFHIYREFKINNVPFSVIYRNNFIDKKK